MSNGTHISSKDLAHLTEAKKLVGSKVVDTLMRHLRLMYAKDSEGRSGWRVEIFDTKFGSTAMKAFPKLRGCNSRVKFKFPDEVVKFFLTEGGFYVDSDCIYISLFVLKKTTGCLSVLT